ncbi:RNA-binding protein 14a isoform X1 [Xiphophorus couchianus]|uniref:RNA-binding protein 14a isoform X1 n=2 Tax=Xiphophorus couchianus TaxID=32473 RepID=UPI001016BC78|nr:RNA-binding protein 4-like isoform X1 [Xiphophorus couchianus]XP_027887394.1 RNA-binding protein 4-like isoform X1 [Xiphophorus couchianus]
MSGENVKLFVGNLPLDATQDELNKLFAPYGEIDTCSLLRQYAFVTLKGEGAADRAIRHLDGKEYRGRPLVVEESRARPPNSIKVFVGNISATCSADDLHGLFSTFGRVLDCDKVKGKARLCSNVGYAFVHMERKEEALAAIEALNGTMFKGRQLAVELSKAQPLINQIPGGGDSSAGGGGREGLLPRPPPSLEHHQSQAAVLAAAAAAAAGLPIQVQQSVHNSFYNTTTFDPTYAALKGLTSSKGADGVIYGALASQVYGAVADQVYQELAHHNPAAEEAEQSAVPDPTTLFEAARAKFFQEGQKVLAEQQAGRKAAAAAATSENERDRSPIRGNRAPLLPDPVPGSFAQIRPKRRTLLPTPPGVSEDAAPATTTSEGADPVARSYSEYYQQMHQYQQYQQYQQQYQYLQYAYTNPPPPPPPPPGSAQTQTPPTTTPAPPGTYTAPPTYASTDAYAAPGTYSASGGYDASSGTYDTSSGNYNASSGSYDASAGYDTSGGYGASGAYDSSGAYPATANYSTSTPYEQTPAHGQPTPQRHDYPYHTPEPPYR